MLEILVGEESPRRSGAPIAIIGAKGQEVPADAPPRPPHRTPPPGKQ